MKPKIEPAGGVFTGPVKVTLSWAEPGVVIKYTTDFYQAPWKESPSYKEPITLLEKATVRARAFLADKPTGELAEAHFAFFKPEIVNATYDWQPQPDKCALMITFAHPDDEAVSFGGAIPLYSVVRKLPTVTICLANNDKVEKDRLRRKELEAALWTYGLRNPPLFANFPDNCYGQPVSCCIKSWGMDKVASYLTEQVRRYRPEVILTHDFYGEYQAPNHIVTAMATYDAYKSAGNAQAFPEQLKDLEPWQPKKLYAHLYPQNNWEHEWDTPYPELGNKTPWQVTVEGIKHHFSQTAGLTDTQGRRFGLVATEVGKDIKGGDFFENIEI